MCYVSDSVYHGDKSAKAEKSWHPKFRNFCRKLLFWVAVPVPFHCIGSVINREGSAFYLDLCVGTSEFCLNGGTCEMTMTGARCHCTDRYQGDRCNTCTERFQGEGCQECSLRFKGVECDTCADGFFGSSCSRNVNFQNLQYGHSVTHKKEETGGGLISP